MKNSRNNNQICTKKTATHVQYVHQVLSAYHVTHGETFHVNAQHKALQQI